MTLLFMSFSGELLGRVLWYHLWTGQYLVTFVESLAIGAHVPFKWYQGHAFKMSQSHFFTYQELSVHDEVNTTRRIVCTRVAASSTVVTIEMAGFIISDS